MRELHWSFLEVYKRLKRQHGARHWWPADSDFEVMVGAILTQNTAWTNVEKAIANLKSHRLLGAQSIANTPPEQLAKVIRPSGYFNVKARRLQAFCQWYIDTGKGLFDSSASLEEVRHALLAVHGIGQETADDILLYALNHPVFVVDAYTRRIFSRLRLVNEHDPYDIIRLQFEKKLPKNCDLYGEYHALIVEHAKYFCRKKPVCSQCMLRSRCSFFEE